MHRTAALAIVLSLAASNATAEIRTIRFDFPDSANYSFLYGYFGEDRPIEGHIISTKLVITDYTTGGALDAADFDMTFDVPTYSDTTWIHLNGAELGWSGHGAFNHTFTTDMYNGEIRSGRFGAEYTGGGSFAGESYIEFTVDALPEDEIFFDSFDIDFSERAVD